MFIIEMEEENTTWMSALGYLFVGRVMTKFTGNQYGLGRKDI